MPVRVRIIVIASSIIVLACRKKERKKLMIWPVQRLADVVLFLATLHSEKHYNYDITVATLLHTNSPSTSPPL